jgi:AcrR family transcriptional regulator
MQTPPLADAVRSRPQQSREPEQRPQQSREPEQRPEQSGRQEGRREQSKAATREAIAAAALDLLRSRTMSGFTADDVAAAAGVSRRTFFNYYSSPEAAIASFTQTYLDSVIEQLMVRPVDEPLLEAAQYALTAVGNPRELALLAETFALTQDHPQAERFQLQAWENCTLRIVQAVRSRLGASPDELYLHTLVGSMLAAGRAAFDIWFARCGPDIGPASLAVLRQLLLEAVGHLRAGFVR